MQNTPENQFLAFTAALCLGVLFIFGRNQSRLIRESILVGKQNAALAAELEVKRNAAEQASLAKSKFFAAASHDLRQPLHALGLFAASLRETAGRNPADGRKLDQVLSSVDALESLFDEFIQLGNPERDRRRGLGLGLATVKRIVELLGHRVELASRPGKGSVFRILVPVGDAARVRQVPPVREPPVDALYGKLVAVVEDDAAVREGMRELLVNWRCRVADGAGADETALALESAGGPPDAIVADYRLREHQTGLAAIAALRARFRDDTPAVLISGDTTPEIFREAQAARMLLLHKPVQPARLRAALSHLLGKA